MMDYFSDVLLVELEPDHEPEPEPVPAPVGIVSVVEKEKEKDELLFDSFGSDSNCKRLTAPGSPRRKPKKHSKSRNQDMIIKGTYYTDSESELIKDGFQLCGLTSNVAELV